MLFGDGAGAAILSEQKGKSKILDSYIQTDGTLEKILYTDGGIASTQTAGHLVMNGREVFKHAVEKMVSTSKILLERNKLSPSDLQWVVPHQANHRIMLAIVEKLNVPQEKLVSTIKTHANTSAASIPIALNAYSNNFKCGDLVLGVAAGAGFTWGGTLIRW